MHINHRLIADLIMMSSWGTKPISFFMSVRSGNSFPLSFTHPEVLIALPVMRLMMVVLPAPDGPYLNI